MDLSHNLTVKGDCESTGLWRDEAPYLQVQPRDLNLPEAIILELNRLVKDYAPILPLSDAQLSTGEMQKEIRGIDARGVKLTKDISKFLGGKFRLRYYSEGLRKHIIDVGDARTRDELHQILAEALRFPDYYGKDWDAFWDCVRDPEQSDVPRGVVIKGIAALGSTLEREVRIFQECITGLKDERPDISIAIE
jgi:ribonuclease inhibitor